MTSRVQALLICVLLALPGCVFMQLDLKGRAGPFDERVLSGEGPDKILLLDIAGVLSSAERKPLLGGEPEMSLLSRVREELDRARRDRRIKAVVLKINSPGGGVTASDTLYHEIKRFKEETGTAIVAHLMDLGTSGAYYTALAADRITAQPTTITGSIGVIMVRIDASGLMEKAGLRAVEIVSGEAKGMGSAFRPIAAAEQKRFQSVIDSLFAVFTDVLARERRLAPDAVRAVSDGRILTSAEAKEAGLLDGIGYLEDAIDLARKQAGLSRARVVSYVRPGGYRPTIYSSTFTGIDVGGLIDPGLQPMYLWWP